MQQAAHDDEALRWSIEHSVSNTVSAMQCQQYSVQSGPMLKQTDASRLVEIY